MRPTTIYLSPWLSKYFHWWFKIFSRSYKSHTNSTFLEKEQSSYHYLGHILQLLLRAFVAAAKCRPVLWHQFNKTSYSFVPHFASWGRSIFHRFRPLFDVSVSGSPSHSIRWYGCDMRIQTIGIASTVCIVFHFYPDTGVRRLILIGRRGIAA